MPHVRLSQQQATVDEDASLTPVDKTSKKLQLQPSETSRLLIKPLATASGVARVSASSVTSMMTSSMTARRASYDSAAHQQYAGTVHQRDSDEPHTRRRVSFQTPEDDYVAAAEPEPPVKRRRFQRRNSKTAAMLFRSMASSSLAICNDRALNPTSPNTVMSESNSSSSSHRDAAESFSSDQERCSTPYSKVIPATAAPDTWDGGLEIAEELVRQLRLRRRSNSFGSTSTSQS